MELKRCYAPFSSPPTSPCHTRCPQINLAPCTILQPHTHPHSEFAFTVYGAPLPLLGRAMQPSLAA
jgi:hypothetical protein